jgi:DNA-binding response OmpR family regulator
MVTGWWHSIPVQLHLKMGANDFLPKPHEPEDLIRRLKNKIGLTISTIGSSHYSRHRWSG